MIEYLNWDSKFLGFKTGMLQQNMEVDLNQQFKNAQRENYKLIYLFADRDYYVPEDLLQKLNGKFVDRKVIYELQVSDSKFSSCDNTRLYDSSVLTNELLQLAYESGQYSRFKLDKNFAPEVFINMYKLWIENSLNGQLADKVFVVEDYLQTLGLVTLKVKADILHIGLIATAPGFQGKGYGKQLINRTVQTTIDMGLKSIEVPTQHDNEQACRFYEACGFKIKSITNIYHFWL